jgi:site-specific DNA recombinase
MAKRVRLGDSKVGVGYIRVSTSRQELGPDAQRSAIEAWAAREGVRIVAWFDDTGVSGATAVDRRSGFIAALASLRTHGAGALVVAKRDRIARDVVVAAMAERAAIACGARLIAADGTANGDTPADQFMRTVIDGAAAYERGLIRARTRAALAEKRAKGEKLGGRVPFGFRVAADGQTLKPIAEEQLVIETVRALRAEGVSLRTIVARLESLGIKSRAGKPLALTQVARIAA